MLRGVTLAMTSAAHAHPTFLVLTTYNPAIISEAGVTAGYAAELLKRNHNGAKCYELGWIPSYRT